MDKEEVRRVIRGHIGEVHHCYEKALAVRRDLEGRVLVRFTIGIDGRVTKSGVQESSLRAPDVEECLALAVRRWRFPETPKPVVVTYPFALFTSPAPTSTPSRRGPPRITEDEAQAYAAWVAARKVVLHHQEEVDGCFSQELARDATLRSLELMVPIAFVLDAEGGVKQAEVERVDGALAGVGACLVERLKTWRFSPPESRKSERLSYAFLFGAKAAKPIEGVDSLASGAIRGVARRHQREIEGCFPVKGASAAARSVPFKFTVNPDGTVADAALASQDTSLAGIAGCLIKQLKTWRFPPPPSGGPEVVVHPFEP